MKKYLLSMIGICLLTCFQNSFGQCTPDQNFVVSGTYPDFLDTARVGEPYSQVIQYHITKDTTVYVQQIGQTVTATIDTLWITGVEGMPNGFSYICHNADCKITGGTTGCATLTGTPGSGQAGIYPLLVLITIRATAMLGPLPISQTVSDTNARYFMVVEPASSISEIKAAQGMILYPNPVKEELQVYLPEVSSAAKYQIRDINGREVLTGEMENNREVKHISMNQLNKGIYFIEVSSNQGSWYRKFILE